MKKIFKKLSLLIALVMTLLIPMQPVQAETLIDKSLEQYPELQCNYNALSSTVKIVNGLTQGHGVIVAQAGGYSYIATNSHVVDRTYFEDGVKSFCSVWVVKDDTNAELCTEIFYTELRDLCFLRVPSEFLADKKVCTVNFDTMMGLKKNDGLFVQVRDFNKYYDYGEVIEPLYHDINGMWYGQTSAEVFPGCSGSGVYDLEGNYVGMTTQIRTWKDTGEKASEYIRMTDIHAQLVKSIGINIGTIS